MLTALSVIFKELVFDDIAKHYDADHFCNQFISTDDESFRLNGIEKLFELGIQGNDDG